MTPFFRVLLDASIRINVVALAVGIALVLGRVRSSSLRHTAWLAVLCAMLSMPILPRLTPRFDVPVSIGAAGLASGDTETRARETPPDLPLASVSANPRESSPEMPKTHTEIWPSLVWLVYASGVAVLLFRLLAGWLFMQRVLGVSRRISIRNAPVYESALVSTPVTVGLKAQKILLPADWSKWPEYKLRAVLAHEMAHVKRRDTLTSFLAQLNRCLFWFHPLAWWLQRQLALTAEQACDDAGVRAVGGGGKYAEVLLDMAERVRRRGNRLICHGVGVDGTGLLGRRIDRILRGAPIAGVSSAQKLLVTLSCACAIFLAAACREKSIYTVELKPDPEYSALLAKQKTGSDFTKAASEMDARQVADLEAALRQNPEDLEMRKKLMIFYQTSGRKVLGDQRTAAGFWAQKLWCIQHRPEDVCASLAEPLSDPAAYQQAKKLWLAMVERKNAPAGALLSAAAFFKSTDPQFAEKILLRVPGAERGRTATLGSIYAYALTGSASQGSYARAVRQKLEQTNDAALLAATGFDLAISSEESGNKPDAIAIGRSYLERALELNPNLLDARRLLERLQEQPFYKKMDSTVGREPSETQYQKVSTLAEADRFRFLPDLAERAYWAGDTLDYYRHDRTAAAKAWELARRYAQDALRLAPGFAGDANYGKCLYKANMTLGMVAMRVDGNKKSARNYLLAASRAQTTDGNPISFTLRLPVLLLKYGGPEERRAVIEYLERYGKILHRPDLGLLLAAKQLRQGTMPLWYQDQATQLK